MAKFINTNYKLTINSLVEGFKKKLDNPYYIYSDKKATLVTYYNINKEKSTLDEGSKLMYEPIGKKSPIRYNKIVDAYLFGIERMALNMDIGDYGLESEPLEGECVVLPNSFIPYPQDYFIINHIESNKNSVLLFKVTSVNMDTLENGANFYKIAYRLSTINKDSDIDIECQVVESYTMLINNVGTEYNCIIRSNDYEFITAMEDILDRVKEYYKSLFFKNRIQTFVFEYDDRHFYDPFMIEFIRRNTILAGGAKYAYISHQVPTSPTFYLDYDNTFFRSLEIGDKTKVSAQCGYASLNTDRFTLLYQRPEDYYIIQYYNDMGPLSYSLNTFDVGLFEAIKNNILFTGEKEYLNIIVQYFNGAEFNSDVIDVLEAINWSTNMELFYSIPVIIFILERTIRKLLIEQDAKATV